MKIDRRTFLRGCGTVLGLPLLPSVGGETAEPQRLAFVFVPNGIHMQDWTPKAAGAGFDLPWLLEPLAPLRDEFSVLSGLTHDKGRANGDGPGDHARSAAVFLTGAQPYKTAGADIKVGVSIDQVLARTMGRRARFGSLELGCEPARQSGQCDSGYSCAYSSNISWRSPRTPMLKEIDPRLVFERLFGAGDGAETKEARARRLAERKSILDFVRADTKRLRKKLGGADRLKLDEYFDGVREIERRIEMSERADRGEAVVSGVKPPAGIPRAYAEHLSLMYDLMVLAFRTDQTRVITFMTANEGSNRTYPSIGVRGGHHTLSHHGGDRRKIEQIRKINRFHMEQFAAYLEKMKDAGLLDTTTIVFGSGISDGNRHNHDDLPVLLAGRGGGAWRPGRHVRYTRNTPMNNLYLSLLASHGAAQRSFGDSTGKLGQL